MISAITPWSLVDALAQAGFTSRVDEPATFVARTRVLPVVHAASGMPVDVVLAGPGLEELFLQRLRFEILEGVRVPVASTEDVVVMKVLAGRPKDIKISTTRSRFSQLTASTWTSPSSVKRYRCWRRPWTGVISSPRWNKPSQAPAAECQVTATVPTAVLCWLVQTCRQLGVDPFAHLHNVTERVSTYPARDILDLTPPRVEAATRVGALAPPSDRRHGATPTDTIRAR